MSTGQFIEPHVPQLQGQESQSPKEVIHFPQIIKVIKPTTSSPGGNRASLDQFQANAIDYFADVAPPELSEIHLRHSRLLPKRLDILPLMPKGGVCAEVGTQTGGFAKHILSVLQPQILHIFDLDYSLFDHDHFRPSIQQGRVQLHQGDSSTLMGALPDKSFDFIYIDGDHAYAGVARDLAQADRKIKDDGWIVCNDYTSYSPLEKCKYGVYRAVNEFCIRHRYEILYFGLQPWGYHDVALRKIGSPAATGAGNASRPPNGGVQGEVSSPDHGGQAEHQRGRPLAEAEIRTGEHRERVGGMWAEIGALQFEFLKQQGLKPNHWLLDIGCGCLRGGVHFVPFLEKRHYCGVDLNASLLEAGQRELLATAANIDKQPDLRLTDQFDLAQFGVQFDYALAFSLFTHLYANHIGRCLVEVKKVLGPEGKFFATFFMAPTPRHLEPIVHQPGECVTYFDHDPFHYSFAEMEMLARFAGLSVQLVGEWRHPRDQQMLCFTAA